MYEDILLNTIPVVIGLIEVAVKDRLPRPTCRQAAGARYLPGYCCILPVKSVSTWRHEVVVKVVRSAKIRSMSWRLN